MYFNYRSNPSLLHPSTKVWEMDRLCVFVLITLVVYRDGFSGNRASASMEDPSNSDYPESELPVKRNSYPLVRSAESQNWADHPNISYFIHESQSEGQISCRLRFTRSKFNFNPFGLRFGKRDHSSIATKRFPETSSGHFLYYLLKLKDKQIPACGLASAEQC
uniref:12-RF amide peptide n=1 Tax=Aquarana catesbeiana TaxID=8400 RepID=B6F0X2_AQUCT|nr:12-RF amide peptide [Aquarana catesbeiana]